MAERAPQTVDEQGSAAGVLLRLWWMLIGNLILVLCLIFIVQHHGVFFHAADPVFGGAVISLILARYVDIRCCRGLTATGTPATMRTWVRYTVFLAVGAPVVWALAHGAGRLLAGNA